MRRTLTLAALLLAGLSRGARADLGAVPAIGVLVDHILVRHWRATPEEDARPMIFLVSD